jgi:hypothetical protein
MWMRMLLPLSLSLCCAILFLSLEAHQSTAGLENGIQLVTRAGPEKVEGFDMGGYRIVFGRVAPHARFAARQSGKSILQSELPSHPSSPLPSRVHIPFLARGGLRSNNHSLGESSFAQPRTLPH